MRYLFLTIGLLLGASAMAGDIVVVMALGAAPMTKDQVADVYLGRSSVLKPIDLPRTNGLRNAFYKMATDRDESQVKAIWSRLIFTGQALPPRELADSAAVKKAVAADPKVVGYIDRSDVDLTVKVVLSLP